uniref:Small ribosomal subunit protein uS3m n=1 Tax=Lecanora markjohnstonii TaxID=2217878 RepID=A0A2Z4KBD2_9LECA|nr:ribosomal protein S3 [Lecanora markjohnstonii]
MNKTNKQKKWSKLDNNKNQYENAKIPPNLNLFNVKLNKYNGFNKIKIEVNENSAGKPKHYVPAHTEWFNSIYAYNQNTIKLLPAAQKVTFKLVKSYFYLYSPRLEKKNRIKGSRRSRMRARRLSTNKVLISKPELKHTNDKVIIVMYVYNRQKKYYLNKIKRIASLDNMDNLLSNKIRKILIKSDGPWPSNLKIKTIRNKTLEIKSKLNKQNNIALKMLKIKTDQDYKINNYEIKVDRTALYGEIYNKKRILQNVKVDSLFNEDTNAHTDSHIKNVLQLSLLKSDFNSSLNKNLTNSLPHNKTCYDYTLYMANTILNLIKYKYISGVRVEVAGRLTKRNKADRSVFKLRYKGNIKNMDSSYKGLPSVLSRGYAKSNLQYTNLKSKIRIGSFGLKSWVSSS